MNKWFLLPGMGASDAMYNGIRHKLDFDISFVNWPAYKGEKTYSEIAKRVIDEHHIEDNDIVGGCSLGGMVSIEISKIIRPKAIILMSSAINTREIQPLLAMVSSIVTITPVALMQKLVRKYKNPIFEMFAEANKDFICAMSLYLRQWSGYTGHMSNIYRLHGLKDHVISCPSMGATIVEEAGHLLVMTHVNETVLFLREVKTQLNLTE